MDYWVLELQLSGSSHHQPAVADLSVYLLMAEQTALA